jgi:hypothetical protein
VPASTTAVEGTHYVLPSATTFHAGRVSDTFEVKLIRAAGLQKQKVLLTLQLLPGDELKTGMVSYRGPVTAELNVQTFKIHLSDELVAGVYWDVFSPYFGTFSAKKVRLINEIAGMPLNYYTTGWMVDASVYARAATWAIAVSRYLAAQKAAGNTIYDEDGTEMLMNASYR